MTDRITLGIETSCDETAAAIVRGEREVLANVIHSQIEQHRPYGGVVPEIASRSHIEKLPGIIERALSSAGVNWDQIDLVAATRGPGLASSLLVGWSAAKGLAMRLEKPLRAVNHLAAHLVSPFINPGSPEPSDALPMVGLVVSGGHTSLYSCETFGEFRLIGRTIDDAAGEALDKAAKLLGLEYPGGPIIDRISRGLEVGSGSFPMGRVKSTSAPLGELRPELCFSFSGLKTALLRRVETVLPQSDWEVARLAAEFQESVVDALIKRCDAALEPRTRSLAVGGGVSLNSRLRHKLKELCEARGVRLLLAAPEHCGDNAAMIAATAAFGIGVTGPQAFAMDVAPSWPL